MQAVEKEEAEGRRLRKGERKISERETKGGKEMKCEEEAEHIKFKTIRACM